MNTERWLYEINEAHPHRAAVVNEEGFTFFQAAAPAYNDITELMERACACVNACSGIPTSILKMTADFEKAGVQTVESVMKQRDELLKDMKYIVEQCNVEFCDNDWARFRATITKAKG